MGYIWIGTESGLARFDGARFKVYTTDDGLPDNEVLGVFFDAHTQRLWIITYSKQPCYYRSGKIYTAQNDSSLRVIKCPFGEFIHANVQSDRLFLFNGSYIYDCANDSIRVLENLIKCNSAYQVSRWGDEDYDVLYEKGVAACHLGAWQHRYDLGNKDTTEIGVWIDRTLIRIFPGRMIFYEKLQSGEYNKKGKVEIPLPGKVNIVIPSRVNGGYIFGVNGKGIFSLDTSLKIVKPLWYGASFNSVYEDVKGNLWIATGDDGLYILRRQQVTSYNAKNGLVHDNVTAMCMDSSGTLIMGNTLGEIYTLKDDKIERVLTNTVIAGKIRQIAVVDNYCFVISDDCVVFDLRTWKGFHIKATAGAPKTILYLQEKNQMLIGMVSSMVTYDIKTGVYKESHNQKRVIDMVRHPDGTIYCASLDGLNRYIGDSLVHVDSSDPRLNGRITSLYVSADSLLWIGTPSNGVVIYDGRKVIGQITMSRYLGYHGAICRRVIQGIHKMIWVATNAGINRIQYHYQDSIVIDQIIPLDMTDGLLSNDVNDILIRDSLIYIATSQGLSVLDKTRITPVSTIPIYITALRINDQDSSIHKGRYELSYSQNDLKIEYVGVLQPVAGDIRYQYRLLGSGNDRWETTGNTSIDFRSLSPGVYTFQVVALDKFGNRSTALASIQFRISQVFYKTIWFWAVMFIVVLGLGFYLIRRRFRIRQRQFEKEQSLNHKIIELEQQALKAQMNPHFIFNCLTAVQHFVNREDLYSANMYLSNFAKLIRKTLDLSGEQYISLDKEVAYLNNYIQLEKMRFQDKFEYTVTVAADIDEYSMQVPPMLLQPIIENAIRHGLRNKDTDTGGMLRIDFIMNGNKLVCTIDDNGVGMKKAAELKTTTHVEYQSKGMKLTMARIQAINMMSEKKITIEIVDKYDDNNEASGTLFILSFEQ